MRALSGELFKTVRRPSVWVCVIGLMAAAVTIGYAIPWLIETFPPAGSSRGLPPGTTLADFKVALYPANFVRQTLQNWSTLGGVFALIVGVLLQGSEYGWATIKTLYTQREGRIVMLLGKLGALAVVVLVLAVGLFAVDALASGGAAAIDGKSLEYPDFQLIVKGVGAIYLIFGFWALFGFTLATLFRQSAMAIGLGLAYALVIEVIIFTLIGSLGGDWVKEIQQWFPLANTGYLASSFGRVALRGLETGGLAPYRDATHAVSVLLAYVVAFVLICSVLLRRRDVTN
ncbi:MAG: ABC transporter permease [Chloroflexi bacterium]|nr:MAG: ABC transporter permease [Chloroflexota bacterium]TME98373.1 MAG: ABC transporter permease [Chloroflexota bacterium]